MRPLLVYLDSSDYSVLSNPKLESCENRQLIEHLKKWIGEGSIICCYSGIHLSEMAPIDAIYSEASQLRANLMVELCNRNAMISQEIIFKAEIAKITKDDQIIIDPLSRNGVWYPEGIPELIAETKVSIRSTLEEVISESAMNRANRRLLKRKTTKGLKAKTALKNSMIQEGRQGSLKEHLSKYPMREQDARVLVRYVAGDATAQEASEAFAESLRDPRWMISWFKDHHEAMSPFIERVRFPIQPVITSLNTLSALSYSFAEAAKARGTTSNQTLISARLWSDQVDEMLTSAVKQIAENSGSPNIQLITSASIEQHCPSLSAGVKSLCSAWHAAIMPLRPRPPEKSDFPDALHAMYAPYVDIFRADSFMSPIIAKHVKKHPVKVVGKLKNLLGTIESSLAERRSNA